MPRIPVHLPTPKLPQPNVTATAEGAAVGQALQGFGAQIQKTASAIDNFQTQNQVSEINNEVTKANSELQLELDEIIRTTEPFKAEEAVDKFLTERVQERFNQIGEIAKTRRAKQHFSGLAATSQATFQTRGVAASNELISIAAADAHQQSVNTTAAAVMNNPDSFDSAVAQLEANRQGLITSGAISREQSIKMRDDEVRALVQGRIHGLIDTGRLTEASQLISRPSFGVDLTILQRIALGNAIEIKQRSFETANDKFRKEQSESYLTDLVTRALAGDNISPGEIVENRHLLNDHIDAKFAASIARGTALSDDARTEVQLTIASKTMDPEEFKNLVVMAMDAQLLTGSRASRFIEENVNNISGGNATSDPLLSGLSFIKSVFAAIPPSTKLAGAGFGLGGAEATFREWREENPNATLREANDEAERIAITYAPIVQDQMEIATPRPYTYVGDRKAITPTRLGELKTLLDADFQAKKISKEVYADQLAIIAANQRLLKSRLSGSKTLGEIRELK